MTFLRLVGALVALAPAAVWACDTCGKVSPAPGQRVVEYDLHISESIQRPAGKPVPVLAINGGTPGPVLRFREGDFARIRVHNDLAKEEVSTHWHGLLLPNAQDGVPHITTPPIRPGAVHTFGFTLRHGGTYWYHSHTHFQEQRGVYGGIVVEPQAGEPVPADREEVLILSDWTNTNPDHVMRLLLQGSEWFGLRRGSLPSVAGALKTKRIGDFFRREWDRMLPMDVSDVAYDAFLVNGQRQVRLAGRPGERVRVRVVNAAAATYFHVSSSLGPLTIVAADGPAVEPVAVPTFVMAIAETYDLLVTIPPRGQHELRFTAHDGSGQASAVFGEGQPHTAPSPPRPELNSMDELLELALAGQEDDPRAALRLPRPGSPYRLLRAREATELPPDLPRRKITLHLTGDMERYVWGFNGRTIAQEPYVLIKKGEVVELELVNDTMMHHPIHLHGHFFRLLEGQGRRSPLKHTVDVPPMSRRTVEFEANEERDWMFHCHILYHMMGGMARVFRYEDAAADAPGRTPSAGHAPGLGEHAHDTSLLWGEGTFLSNRLDGVITWSDPANDVRLSWEVGWGKVDDPEYEVDLAWQRYLDPNFQLFAGYRFTNQADAANRAFAGFNYRLPLMVWATAELDSEGDARLGLAKRLQLTPRLAAWGHVQYDTNTAWEWSVGADWALSRTLSLTASFHSEFGAGVGVRIRF